MARRKGKKRAVKTKRKAAKGRRKAAKAPVRSRKARAGITCTASEEATVTLDVNGQTRRALVSPSTTLLEVLRDDLGLKGTNKGCGTGDCGACTVILDGKAVNSCLVLAFDASGSRVRTIEGLAPPGDLHPVQRAFVEGGAVQCGFCTPGMIMTAVAFLEGTPDPTEEECKRAISGNLCRCTGYKKIVAAIMAAAEVMRDG